MRVLDPPAAPGAAAWEGFAVRRDWLGGHELVGYRLSEDDALVFALVDQRMLAGVPAEVTHSVVPITVVAYELHVGKLCTAPECPQGTPVSADAWARVGEVR
jgi:hypothetical protein